MKLNIKNVLFSLVVLVVGAFAFNVSSVSAATCTAATGNWSDVGTWTGCGGAVPTSVDDVVIGTGVTVTITNANGVGNPAQAATVTLSNPGTSSNALTLQTDSLLQVSGALTLAGSSGVGNSTVTNTSATLVVGSLAINGGSVGNSVLTSNGVVTVHGNVTFTGVQAQAQLTLTAGYMDLNNGTISAGGTVSWASPTSIFSTGTSAINGAYTLANITVSSGTLTLGAAVFLTGYLEIDGGTFNTSTYDINVTGTTTIGNGATMIHGTGAKTHNGNVVINTGGTWTETGAAVVNFLGNVTNNGTFTALTGVHTFGTYTRTLNGTFSIPNATFTGNYTNNGTLTVNNALTGSGSLTNNGSAILNIGGTSTISGITATATGNEVHYTGTNQTVYPTDYDKLFLEGSGVKTIGSSIDISDALSINSGVSTALTGASTALSLFLNGNLQYVGSWGSTSSGASNTNNTYFSGNGIVTTATGPTRPSITYSGSMPTSSVVPVISNNSTACAGGEMFDSTTGKACISNTTNVSCTSGQIYNPSNGQKCTTWTGGMTQTPTTSMTYAFGTTLVKLGTQGDACKAWQTYFNDKDNAGLVVDGKCGPKTMDFAKKWQSTMGLKVDGMLGAMSRAKAI